MSDVSSNEELNNEISQTILVSDSIDYSNYFENLQIIGIIICTILIGSAMALCFLKGFGK